MSRRTVVLGAAVAAVVATAVPAWAHVEIDPWEAPAGSETRLAFNVEHGCDHSPTISFSIKLPHGVDADAEAKEGWEILAGHHTVTWKGGVLAADSAGEFAVVVELPNSPGATLSFPAVQTCEMGMIHWDEIAPPGVDPETLLHPAPSIKLT